MLTKNKVRFKSLQKSVLLENKKWVYKLKKNRANLEIILCLLDFSTCLIVAFDLIVSIRNTHSFVMIFKNGNIALETHAIFIELF